jgi:uncharacterized protein (DUF697 family)
VHHRSHSPKSPRLPRVVALGLLILVGCLLVPSLAIVPTLDAQEPAPLAPSVDQATGSGAGIETGQEVDWGKRLWHWFLVFLALSAIALVLLVGVTYWLLRRAKKLVANALDPDVAKLEKRLDRLRAKQPGADVEALASTIASQQAFRTGLVGFVTGLGGLPFLPLTLPIDIALTVRYQAELVHLLRLLYGVDELPEAGLWIVTAGSQELTSASSAAIRNVLLKYVSKSLLKFLPLIGGLVGFALNWLSTRALGRLSRHFFESGARA